jgi:hypothetical protein
MPPPLKLGIVSATTNPVRAAGCIASWQAHATRPDLPRQIVENQYVGTVPAFRLGVHQLLHKHRDVEIVACFHDDLEILEDGWDEMVVRAFTRYPDLGLAGFGGAIGLGSDDLYHEPYNPMQLARIGFRSNLVDAEAHGTRSLFAEPVVCLDGFSQIGRHAFFTGLSEPEWRTKQTTTRDHYGAWRYLEKLGVVHHFYDGMLGCLARRQGWQVRYLPVACRHYGGQTAVGDPGYQRWAADEIEGGDRGFWEAAHRIGYDTFRDVLPLRLQS